jgi:hypothetical protein
MNRSTYGYLASSVAALAMLAIVGCSETPGPTTSSISAATTPEVRPIPGDGSGFVGENVPDGTAIKVGRKFEKIWELRNVGTIPWMDRYLSRQGGSDDSGTCATDTRVRIPDTAPGQTVKVEVRVTAPDAPSVCHVVWKITDADGRHFFPDKDGVWFDVVVVP